MTSRYRFCSKVFLFLGFFSSLVQASPALEYLFTPSPHKPRIEWGLKTGNKRDLSRLGAVIPLYETQSGLWFTNLFGLWDSSGALEGNFGLGYRQLSSDFILGGYGFFDRRKTSYGHRFNQLTLGGEILREHVEFRVNGYWPLGVKEALVQEEQRIRRVNFNVIQESTRKVEKALGGFDVELGGSLPSFNPLSGYVAYYRFDANGIKAVSGVRFRSQLQLTEFFSLEAELSRDRLRKTAYFAGLKLEVTLGRRAPLSGLQRKMTQMAIRDIDIVTDTEVIPNAPVVLMKEVPMVEDVSVAPPEENSIEVPEEVTPEPIPEVLPPNPMELYNPTEDLQALGLESGADWSAIKKAYRKLVLVLHPDKAREHYVGEIKRRHEAVQEAYSRLTHWQQEEKEGRQIWVPRKDVSITTQSPTPVPSSTELSSCTALIPYREVRATPVNVTEPPVAEAPTTTTTERAPVEITAFTGGGEDIGRIVVYTPREVVLKPKSPHEPEIAVNAYDIEGVPKDLPLTHLQRFVDNSYWRVQRLSSGEYKVIANVKGLGGMLPALLFIGEVVVSTGTRVMVGQALKQGSKWLAGLAGTTAFVEGIRQAIPAIENHFNPEDRGDWGLVTKMNSLSSGHYARVSPVRYETTSLSLDSGVSAPRSTLFLSSSYLSTSNHSTTGSIDYSERARIEQTQREFLESVRVGRQAASQLVEGWNGTTTQVRAKLDNLSSQLSMGQMLYQFDYNRAQSSASDAVERWVETIKALPGLEGSFWRRGWTVSMDSELSSQIQEALRRQSGSSTSTIQWSVALTGEDLEKMERLQLRHQDEAERLLRAELGGLSQGLTTAREELVREVASAKRQFESTLDRHQRTFDSAVSTAVSNYHRDMNSTQSHYEWQVRTLETQSTISARQRGSEFNAIESTRYRNAQLYQSTQQSSLESARTSWYSEADNAISNYRNELSRIQLSYLGAMRAAVDTANSHWSSQLSFMKHNHDHNWSIIKSEIQGGSGSYRTLTISAPAPTRISSLQVSSELSPLNEIERAREASIRARGESMFKFGESSQRSLDIIHRVKNEALVSWNRKMSERTLVELPPMRLSEQSFHASRRSSSSLMSGLSPLRKGQTETLLEVRVNQLQAWVEDNREVRVRNGWKIDWYARQTEHGEEEAILRREAKSFGEYDDGLWRRKTQLENELGSIRGTGSVRIFSAEWMEAERQLVQVELDDLYGWLRKTNEAQALRGTRIDRLARNRRFATAEMMERAESFGLLTRDRLLAEFIGDLRNRAESLNNGQWSERYLRIQGYEGVIGQEITRRSALGSQLGVDIDYFTHMQDEGMRVKRWAEASANKEIERTYTRYHQVVKQELVLLKQKIDYVGQFNSFLGQVDYHVKQNTLTGKILEGLLTPLAGSTAQASVITAGRLTATAATKLGEKILIASGLGSYTSWLKFVGPTSFSDLMERVNDIEYDAANDSDFEEESIKSNIRDLSGQSANPEPDDEHNKKSNKKTYEKIDGISEKKIHKNGYHFDKHGRGMGYNSKRAYDTAAKQFGRTHMNNPNAKLFEGKLNLRDKNAPPEIQRAIQYEGKTLIFDPETGQVMNFYEGDGLSAWARESIKQLR